MKFVDSRTGREFDVRSRRRKDHQQLLTSDFHKALRYIYERLSNAYCVIGVTMFDLTSHINDEFVFGQADPQYGTGIFSFSRYSGLLIAFVC